MSDSAIRIMGLNIPITDELKEEITNMAFGSMKEIIEDKERMDDIFTEALARYSKRFDTKVKEAIMKELNYMNFKLKASDLE